MRDFLQLICRVSNPPLRIRGELYLCPIKAETFRTLEDERKMLDVRHGRPEWPE